LLAATRAQGPIVRGRDGEKERWNNLMKYGRAALIRQSIIFFENERQFFRTKKDRLLELKSVFHNARRGSARSPSRWWIFSATIRLPLLKLPWEEKNNGKKN